MREYEFGRIRIVSPATVEEMLRAIGAKEDDETIEIMLSTELIADLCVRLVRLEDIEERKDDD